MHVRNSQSANNPPFASRRVRRVNTGPWESNLISKATANITGAK